MCFTGYLGIQGAKTGRSRKSRNTLVSWQKYRYWQSLKFNCCFHCCMHEVRARKGYQAFTKSNFSFWTVHANETGHYPLWQEVNFIDREFFTTGGQLTEAERRDQPPPYRGNEQVRVKSWVMFLLQVLGGSLNNNESDGNEVVKTRTI